MARNGLANTPASRSRPHVVENAYRKVHGRNLIAGRTLPNPAAARPAQQYADLTRDDLRDEAEARGLPKSGTKAELIERLEADDR